MDVDLGCSSYLARLLACLLEGLRWSTDHWAVGAAGYLPASRWLLGRWCLVQAARALRARRP